MEVFPLENASQDDVKKPSMSQVEQMKSWESSFTQLEEMLQAACESDKEIERTLEEHTVPGQVSQPLDISNELEGSADLSCAEETNRKRHYSESAGSEDSFKEKLFKASETLPAELPPDLNGSSREQSNTSDQLSQVSTENTEQGSLGVHSEQPKELGMSPDAHTDVGVSGDTSISSSETVHHKTLISVGEQESPSVTSSYDDNCYQFLSTQQLPISEHCPVYTEANSGGTELQCSASGIQDPLPDLSKELEASEDNAGEEAGGNGLELKPVVCEKDVDDEIPAPANDSEPKAFLKSSDNLSVTADSSSESKENRERKKDDDDKNSKKGDKSKKRKFERCNIRDIKLEEELDAVTLSAQKEEQERIKRLQEAQMRALQERLQIIEVEKEALTQLFGQTTPDEQDIFTSESETTEPDGTDKADIPVTKSETDVVLVEGEGTDDIKPKLQGISPQVESEENVIDISSSSSGSESDDDLDKKDDEVLVLSDGDTDDADAGPDDPNNSGAHTNDCFNLPDEEGRVLVNVGHPPEDPDIYLAPQIAKVIKPHQIGGIRFLYDNVVENLERYKSSSGFGCILAHSMGLGKTVQVVSFVDVFLRHTPATLVLCIVPINTIQNWKAEFDMWVPPPESVDQEQVKTGEVRPRDYNVYTLNENFKSMAARASLIAEWRSQGGVLLMGYEMYRMLALRKMPKIPVKKYRRLKKQENPIEPESVEQIKKFMDQMYEHIVIPGPDLVICDEGHRIKNSLASTSMALKSIKTRRRVVLTGYPLQNNLLEYWCMVDFVRPNYLGSRAEFCNMFERPISNGQCIDSTPRDRQLMRFRSHVLHSLLVGFVQRRGHSVLRAVLPKKEEHVLLVRMTPIQRQLYKCFVKDLLYVQQATNPLKLFAVCCKIWNHPDILYKLLQEKRAQEDIDLDIDLNTSASGALAGTNDFIKKKMRGQSKARGIERTLKSDQLKTPSDISIPKSEESQMQASEFHGRTSLPIKVESNLPGSATDQKVSQHMSAEQGHISDMTSRMHDESSVHSGQMHSPVGAQDQSPGLRYSHASGHTDSIKRNSFSQSQYTQQSESFAQPSYSQANLDQCQTVMHKSSSQYLSHNSLNQSQCQQYPPHSSQNSQHYANSSLSQFSQSGNSQNYSQQLNLPTQTASQHYSGQTSMEQNFSTQSASQDNFQRQVSQFSAQSNSQQFTMHSNLSQQQYSQQFSQQSSALPSQLSFSQETTQQQFGGQKASQSVSSQNQFNQQPQTSQQSYNHSAQQFSQQSPMQMQQYTSTPPPVQQQYGQQASQKYSEHQSQQQHSYNESRPLQHQSYHEHRERENQNCHNQSSQQQGLYSDNANVPQQFSQSLQQQQFCQSSAPPQQIPQRSSSQQSRSQTSFSQPSGPLESQSPFPHPAASPRQHQQPSSQFIRQSPPMQPFSQCSPSQQQSFSQNSPPMQQSPTQQRQYSLSSPTQQQPYQPSFSQLSPKHQQYVPQQSPHHYPQESASQQSYSQQTQYGQKSPQQCSQPSASQHFSVSQKQGYSQQYVQHSQQYPGQSSPQQQFVQQSRQSFSFSSSSQQQQYGHQPVQPHKSQMAPQSPRHQHFSQASADSLNHGQQFGSSSHTSSSSQFCQQTQLPSQQFSLQHSEQYSVQTMHSNSQQNFNQNASSEYVEQVMKGQYSQPSQQSTSQAFMSSPSSPQSYMQQSKQFHSGLQPAAYQHGVAQQQNSQPSFKPYQPQSHPAMDSTAQMHHASHQNASMQSQVKDKSKQFSVQSFQQKLCEKSTDSVQSQPYPQQTCHNVGMDQIHSKQQSGVPAQGGSSLDYQGYHSAVGKKETVDENSRADGNTAFPSKCVNSSLPAVLPKYNSLPYRQGVKPQGMAHENSKCEGESFSVPLHEPVTPSYRDKLDSSISYEWAIPIMKDYAVGVLENSHKMMILFAIIKQTVQKGDKLLVFSQSLSTLDLLEHFLGRSEIPLVSGKESDTHDCWCRNKNYFRLDGSTSAQEREKLINEFNKNDSVSLFLLSTRAGCLGINLVGANRIVVMDASWNPCHDAQAVCRIYRYGQKKQCHIYRLVTDNSLEKRIYDRQVNKQGMSDRVVDELNPESNFTWKDVTTLIQDDEDDGPVQDLAKFEESYTDEVLKFLVSNMSASLSKEPFEHESLLLDRKDLKLTKQEKRLAKQSYEMAKRANMINIRSAYTYVPGNTGQFIINKQCQWIGGTAVRVLPGQTVRGAGRGTTATPITASPSLMNSLFKQGVMVQKLTIPSNISIPVLTPGAPPVVVPAGQDVLVLRTPKGVYLRLPDGRIIAVQLPPSLLAKTQFRPNVVTHFRPNVSKGNQGNVGNTPRGQSIGIIKQTLQCGGTVRYLGPKSDTGSTSQNSQNTAPEVIDLSDDDEPSVKKSTLQTSETDSAPGDQEYKSSVPSVLPGKQVTIRRVSPGKQSSPIQLPLAKDKCDLPLKLQQNQQITIMPINPAQQNRQKTAPQLAQTVRVQQMLIQAQQGKRKPMAKSSPKSQVSPLPIDKSLQRQEVTITPTQPSPHKSQHSSLLSPLQSLQKSPDNTEQNKMPSQRAPSSPGLSIKTLSEGESNSGPKNDDIPESDSKDHENNSRSVANGSGPSPLEPEKMVSSSCTSYVSTAAAAKSKPSETSPDVPFSVCEALRQVPGLSNQVSQVTACSSSSGFSAHCSTQDTHATSAFLSYSHSSLSGAGASPAAAKQQQPETSVSVPGQSAISFSSCLPHESQFSSLHHQKSALSDPYSQSGDQIPISQSNVEKESRMSSPHSTVGKIMQVERGSGECLERASASLYVPKSVDSVSTSSGKIDLDLSAAHTSKSIHDEAEAQRKLNMPHAQPAAHHLDTSLNGQLHSDSSFVQQQISKLEQQSKKKKVSSRQTSKKELQHAHSQAGVQSSQQQPQISAPHHQFSHPQLSEHLHDHRFPSFGHLDNSDFQPFQNYQSRKPALHIQHPQPLHPLHQSQEHSLSSHMPPMPHIYSMTAHMSGNTPSLTGMPPQTWPVQQPSMSSFHPFGQSSQYYPSRESTQFPFQPSSFAIPQPAASHAPQSESAIGLPGLDHVSSACSSEL